VQGVSYRASARRQAASLGLVGWARNLADGRVEMLAEGSPADISAFIDWCRRGPHWARVDTLDVLDEAPAEEFAEFSVRRDG
jgi:acylphosphatase